MLVPYSRPNALFKVLLPPNITLGFNFLSIALPIFICSKEDKLFFFVYLFKAGIVASSFY
jgi:hypothetical protein